MCSKVCCAVCYSFLTVLAVALLPMIGYLCQSKSYLIEVDHKAMSTCATGSWTALVIYGCVGLGSVLYLVYRPKPAEESPFQHEDTLQSASVAGSGILRHRESEVTGSSSVATSTSNVSSSVSASGSVTESGSSLSTSVVMGTK